MLRNPVLLALLATALLAAPSLSNPVWIHSKAYTDDKCTLEVAGTSIIDEANSCPLPMSDQCMDFDGIFLKVACSNTPEITFSTTVFKTEIGVSPSNAVDCNGGTPNMITYFVANGECLSAESNVLFPINGTLSCTPSKLVNEICDDPGCDECYATTEIDLPICQPLPDPQSQFDYTNIASILNARFPSRAFESVRDVVESSYMSYECVVPSQSSSESGASQSSFESDSGAGYVDPFIIFSLLVSLAALLF